MTKKIDLRGKIVSVAQDIKNKGVLVTFSVDDKRVAMFGDEELSITVKKYHKKRSLDANALFWACLSEIADALDTDKWQIYLRMLKKYGKFDYVCIKPHAVDAFTRSWRECEEIGTININGTEAVQLLCYYGSSTYDTKEFSRLLNGTISEMKEMELMTPTERQLQDALDKWEKMTAKKEEVKDMFELDFN